jgi:hypothetical protein
MQCISRGQPGKEKLYLRKIKKKIDVWDYYSSNYSTLMDHKDKLFANKKKNPTISIGTMSGTYLHAIYRKTLFYKNKFGNILLLTNTFFSNR